MGFCFELDTTDILYKECDIRINRYSFFTKKTYYTRVIRNGLIENFSQPFGTEYRGRVYVYLLNFFQIFQFVTHLFLAPDFLKRRTFF